MPSDIFQRPTETFTAPESDREGRSSERAEQFPAIRTTLTDEVSPALGERIATGLPDERAAKRWLRRFIRHYWDDYLVPRSWRPLIPQYPAMFGHSHGLVQVAMRVHD